MRERIREQNRETGGKCGKAEVRNLSLFFGFVRERERKRRETEIGVVGIVRDMGVIGERGPEEDRAFRGTGGETPQ